MDEAYRKALKLDSDRFSTTFSPYETGIIGAITQTLLPGFAKPFTKGNSKAPAFECLGVIAELYKLNVRACLSLSVHWRLTNDCSFHRCTLRLRENSSPMSTPLAELPISGLLLFACRILTKAVISAFCSQGDSLLESLFMIGAIRTRRSNGRHSTAIASTKFTRSRQVIESLLHTIYTRTSSLAASSEIPVQSIWILLLLLQR